MQSLLSFYSFEELIVVLRVYINAFDNNMTNNIKSITRECVKIYIFINVNYYYNIQKLENYLRHIN